MPLGDRRGWWRSLALAFLFFAAPLPAQRPDVLPGAVAGERFVVRYGAGDSLRAEAVAEALAAQAPLPALSEDVPRGVIVVLAPDEPAVGLSPIMYARPSSLNMPLAVSPALRTMPSTEPPSIPRDSSTATARSRSCSATSNRRQSEPRRWATPSGTRSSARTTSWFDGGCASTAAPRIARENTGLIDPFRTGLT